MTRLDANDAIQLPISTDHDIEQRVASLLQRAIRRQWWTLYLDADDLQRPVVMPMPGYPAHPHEPCGADGTAAEVLANRLASIVAEIEAAKVIFVWEAREVRSSRSGTACGPAPSARPVAMPGSQCGRSSSSTTTACAG